MESQFAQNTGLKIVMPASAPDAKGLLLQSIRDPDPVLFLEPLRGYRMISGEVPDGDYTVPFGELRTVREGSDVTLVAWSGSVPVAAEAAELLDDKGISAHVVDLRTLVPLDEAGLVAALERTGRCVVVHEAPATAGFGAEVVALLQEQALLLAGSAIATCSRARQPLSPSRSGARLRARSRARGACRPRNARRLSRE